MIGFFPAPYEDELIYSWLCRYMVWSGYTSATDAYRDLYENIEVHPSIELLNNLTKDARIAMERTAPLKELVLNHTLFPEYARFIAPAKRERLLTELDFTRGNWINSVMRPAAFGERYLRYCPVCVKEDREMYGETFWHRQHQIYGIVICVRHGVYLQDSSVLINVRLTRLKAAEIVIEGAGDAVECKDRKVRDLAEYMEEVFLSPVYSYDSIGKALGSRIGVNYIRSNGDRKMNELYADYCLYYKSLSENALMSHNVMTRIFSGHPGLFGYICQLGLFIGLSAHELLSMREETANEAIYARVASQTGETVDKIRIIGEVLMTEWKRSKMSFLRSERQKDHLDEEDRRLVSQVRSVAERIYDMGEARPRKVSLSLVSRELHVDMHKLKKMRRCMKALEPYWESQEHYWAREIVWTVNELERRGEPLNFKHLRGLINLRRENIIDSLEELKGLNEQVWSLIKTTMMP